MYIVLCGYLHILGAPTIQSCSPYRYLLRIYLYVADIVCSWISLDIIRFDEEQFQPSSASA